MKNFSFILLLNLFTGMVAYATYPDEQLLKLLRNNDEAAFTTLYQRYLPQLSRHVWKIIRIEEDAKDIVQEVFLSIWRRRAELEITGSFSAYLKKSVQNLSIRYIQRNISRATFLTSLHQATKHLAAPPPEQALEVKQLQEQLARAVASLPPKMQEVYRLSRQQQLTYKEISIQLGIAETTVKKQINNALKLIGKSGDFSVTVVMLMLLTHTCLMLPS